MSVPAGVGLILNVAGFGQYAAKAVAVGILFLAVIIGSTFCVGGRSLVKAINESLRQHHQRQLQETATALTAGTAATGATGENGDENEQQDGGDRADGRRSGLTAPGAGDQPLLAARTKIKRMMIFALQTVVMVMSMLLVTIFTGYGVAAPLPLFLVPSECSR